MSLSPEWKYRVSISTIDWQSVETWCDDNIGRFNKDWYKLGLDPLDLLHGISRTVWYFKKEQDAMFFKLRWQ